MIIAACLLACSAVRAADSGTAAEPDKAAAQEVMSRAAPTDPAKPVSQPSAISLTSTQDATTATLKGTFGGTRHLSPGEQTTGAFTATLSSPVTKGSNATNLTALNGLANATTLALQYSRFHLHILTAPLQELHTLVAACTAHELRAYELAQQDLVRLERDSGKARDTGPMDGIIAALEQSRICNDFVPSGTPLDTTAFEVRAGIDIRAFSPQERVELLKALEAWQADSQALQDKRKALRAGYALAYGLTGKVGYETHDYYESPSLPKRTLDAKPWSAGAYVTYVAPGWNWAVTAQYDYQAAYKDQTATTQCPAPAAEAPTTCVAGAFGLPQRSIKDLFTLEWRYKHPINKWFGGDSIAVAPSATYDVASRIYGFTTLLFLFGGGDSGLTGGLNAHWQSDRHQVTAGIFVTQPFSITGQASP